MAGRAAALSPGGNGQTRFGLGTMRRCLIESASDGVISHGVLKDMNHSARSAACFASIESAA
jgi:hypothetical protein